MTALDRLTRIGTWREHDGVEDGTQWAFEPIAVDCLARQAGGVCPCAVMRQRAQLCDDGGALMTCGLTPGMQANVQRATGELSISRRGLTLLAAAAYGVPLAMLLAGAAIGQALGGDGLAAVLGIAAALPGFMLFRRRGAALLARLEMSWQVPSGMSGKRAETDSAQSTREFWTS